MVQFHLVVLAICYLPLHSPEMNVFKPERIDGDHSIAFILVSLSISLFLSHIDCDGELLVMWGLIRPRFVLKWVDYYYE